MPAIDRTQHHGDRNRQHGAEHETGHVLDALAQRPGHRGGHARERRQGSEIGIMLARRVPGQHPGCHRRKRAFGRQAPTVLPVPRTGPGRGQAATAPVAAATTTVQGHPAEACSDHHTALHPPPLPRTPQPTPPAHVALTQRHPPAEQPARPPGKTRGLPARLTSWPYPAQPVIPAGTIPATAPARRGTPGRGREGSSADTGRGSRTSAILARGPCRCRSASMAVACGLPEPPEPSGWRRAPSCQRGVQAVLIFAAASSAGRQTGARCCLPRSVSATARLKDPIQRHIDAESKIGRSAGRRQHPAERQRSRVPWCGRCRRGVKSAGVVEGDFLA